MKSRNHSRPYPSVLRASAATLLSALALSCTTGGSPLPPQGPFQKAKHEVSSEVSLEAVGLSSTAMDPLVNPCEDFYRYACGGWLEETELPSDQSRWGRSRGEVRKRNEQVLREVLTDAAAHPSGGPVTAALGAYYGACMDEETVEKAGLSGIQSLLDRAAAVRSPQDASHAIAELHSSGIMASFNLFIDQDFKSPDVVMAYLLQGGLGLPDREYYTESKYEQQRKFYRTHVEKMFRLAGLDSALAAQAARDVMRIETELAQLSKPRAQMRSFQGFYNKVDPRDLLKTAPGFDWLAYFAAQGVPELQALSVSSKRYFIGLSTLLSRLPAQTWSHYLQWTILHHSAPHLPRAFVEENFSLVQRLKGQKKQKPRWKHCAQATDKALREYTGQAYVARSFSAEAKSAVKTMTNAISDAFATELKGYEWMDEATRERALDKRARLTTLVGHPDHWKSYPFKLEKASYTANWLAAQRHAQHLEWSKTQKAVDRREWPFSVAVVNAGYHPVRNAMSFPAGILQAPIYNPQAGVAVNLGSLGMIVGHELTHAFDDQGSHFTAGGVMKNWWSPEVKQAFDAKKECLVELYDSYEVLADVHLNGQLSLGENTADLGGVKLALHAYRTLRQGKAPIVAGGYSEDQQFFLSVAQSSCTQETEESLRQRVTTDPHSPAEFRVRGALSNLPEFAEAFQCQAGAAYAPKQRCEIW